MSEVFDALRVTQDAALAAMKAGQDIGFRDGMLRAIKICEEKSKLHERYLPPHHYYMSGDLHQAATCGRRDEAQRLAEELREILNATR